MGLYKLVFLIDDIPYAVPLNEVVHAIRVVATTPLPESPDILFGMFDLHGQTIPVISLRRLLSFENKDIELEDMLIIIKVHDKDMAILVDKIEGVFKFEKEEAIESEELFPELIFQEIVKWQDKLVAVLDMEAMIDKEIVHHISLKTKKGDIDA